MKGIPLGRTSSLWDGKCPQVPFDFRGWKEACQEWKSKWQYLKSVSSWKFWYTSNSTFLIHVQHLCHSTSIAPKPSFTTVAFSAGQFVPEHISSQGSSLHHPRSKRRSFLNWNFKICMCRSENWIWKVPRTPKFLTELCPITFHMHRSTVKVYQKTTNCGLDDGCIAFHTHPSWFHGIELRKFVMNERHMSSALVRF